MSMRSQSKILCFYFDNLIDTEVAMPPERQDSCPRKYKANIPTRALSEGSF